MKSDIYQAMQELQDTVVSSKPVSDAFVTITIDGKIIEVVSASYAKSLEKRLSQQEQAMKKLEKELQKLLNDVKKQKISVNKTTSKLNEVAVALEGKVDRRY